MQHRYFFFFFLKKKKKKKKKKNYMYMFTAIWTAMLEMQEKLYPHVRFPQP